LVPAARKKCSCRASSVPPKGLAGAPLERLERVETATAIILSPFRK